MDELSQFNRDRWNALAAANIQYSRPLLDLDPAAARRRLDPYDVMLPVAGKDVLCLASGGGQQSVAFALLGAYTTVFDLSDVQLERDRAAAAHHKVDITVEHGDMRDLSRFADDSFDLVWHAYSINFLPDPRPVLAEVGRVLRPGGQYRVQWMNPFVAAVDERNWLEGGYLLNRIYEDGELTFADPHWEVYDEEGAMQRVVGPREFRHTLSTFLNSMIQNGLMLLGIWEEMEGLAPDPQADPGTWEHFVAVAPPWLTCWARRQISP